MMKPPTSKSTPKPRRIELTDQMRNRLASHIFKGSTPELAKRTRLPYALVYNLLHQRVKSISARHYRMLFGEAPPHQEKARVDGTFFRQMVDLWLYLNDDSTVSDLYREFCGERQAQKVDHRIFNGQTASIDAGLETRMQEKFLSVGLDPATIRQWIDERKEMVDIDRVAYAKIRPALLFLQNVLGVHPTFLLNQLFSRYENGDLKSVAHPVFFRATEFKKKVETALKTGNQFDLERIKEEIYGQKPGYTLYSKIVEELKFLKTYARISPKRYLGRSSHIYDNGKAKRITSQRAAKVIDDCEAFIRQHPELPLNAFPLSYRKRFITPLLAVILVRAAKMLSQDEGIVFEKHVLTPSHSKSEYEKERYGFTLFDRAPTALGMKKKAFDLMVAKNCEIFRGIGHYAQRWYLSDLYLKEIAEKESFELITTKYELMAITKNSSEQINSCML